MDSLPLTCGVDQSEVAGAADRLQRFRAELYGCLGQRRDELFELTDALLCADGPVRSLVELSLEPEHRRGHGALYDAVNHGTLDVERLSMVVAGLPVPRMFGRIVLAVDGTGWLRPDAPTCPERLFCHVYGRGRHRGADQQIPGWPYQLVVALESGATSWTAALDARRLHPADDPTAVTATQLRKVVGRLQQAGHWRDGDPPIMVMLDSGYDVHRLAYLLDDLPVRLVGRLRANRVLLGPAPPPGRGSRGGRPRRHGAEMKLDDPSTWPAPTSRSVTDTPRYGQAEATGWDRMHPRLAHRGAWADHPGELPIVEGTLIRLAVEHLPGQREAKPVWLWSTHTAAGLDDDLDEFAAEVIRCWQAYLRRFDEEHMIRFWKQVLGWTAPKIRSPEAADRWTWLVIAVHTQLRLARYLAADLRRPWESPLPAERLTPSRVRRGFRHLRAKMPLPASAPKPSRPGPGRPPGAKNRHRAAHYDVGKTVKRNADDRTGQQPKG